MSEKYRFLFFIIFFLHSSDIFSVAIQTGTAPLAKVTFVRGNVVANVPGFPSPLTLKGNEELSDGTKVITSPKSVAKVSYKNDTQVTLGPESELIVHKITEEGTGLITTLKGQVQATVSKYKGGEEGEQKDKLIVRTPSASMGVRGTEFIVVVNTANANTSLVLLEGVVKMAPTQGDMDIATIRQRLSSPAAVSVKTGEFSLASKDSSALLPPTKISPAQLDALKNSSLLATVVREEGGKRAAPPPAEKKATQSPIPPGVSGQVLSSPVTITAPASMSVAIPSQSVVTETFSPPPQTESVAAPLAGGLVDLKTGVYIPPPANSVFDSNTGVFVPPPSMGTVDSVTGAYVAPEGLALNQKGEFVVTVPTTTEASPTSPPPLPAPVVVAVPQNTQEAPPVVIPEKVTETVGDKISSEIEQSQQTTIQSLSKESSVEITILAK